MGNANTVVGGQIDTQWGMLTLLWTDRYTVGNVNAVVDRQVHSGEC